MIQLLLDEHRAHQLRLGQSDVVAEPIVARERIRQSDRNAQ
jgi:hypothetical protein